MGIMDRLNGAKRRLWSPMQVWMAELGSDRLVHAGATAKVIVEVRGEDDGTAERTRRPPRAAATSRPRDS